jgi:hypothetical protein
MLSYIYRDMEIYSWKNNSLLITLYINCIINLNILIMKKNSLVLFIVAVLALFTTLPLLTLGLWEALAAYSVACVFWLGMLAPAFSSKGD